MKICLLGATGQTGQAILYKFTKFLAKPDNGDPDAKPLPLWLTGIARNPDAENLKLFSDKFPDRIKFIKGNIFNAESLKTCFEDHDLIIYALGFKGDTQQYVRSCKAVLEAMTANSIEKIMFVGTQYHDPETRKRDLKKCFGCFCSFGSGSEGKGRFSKMMNLVVSKMLKTVFDDHHNMVEHVLKSPENQHIHWHYVACPVLGEYKPPLKLEDVKMESTRSFGSFALTEDDDGCHVTCKYGYQMCRSDVASYMLWTALHWHHADKKPFRGQVALDWPGTSSCFSWC